MTETTGSEEQAREYARQLRTAPAEQLVTELVSGLINAAQVKLGRRDARLLIDLTAVVVDHARPYLSPPLARQLDQILGQLRLAQVRAEEAAGSPRQPEANDLSETPHPPPEPAGEGATAATPPPPPSSPSPPPPPTSRLWVPGRDF